MCAPAARLHVAGTIRGAEFTVKSDIYSLVWFYELFTGKKV